MSIPLGARPVVIFSGTVFDYDEKLKRAKNLIHDFFVEGVQKDSIDILTEPRYVISVTGTEKSIHLRFFYVRLRASELEKLKNGEPELSNGVFVEIAPRIRLTLGRSQIAKDEEFNQACKQRKIKAKKHEKNISKNQLGDRIGRVYVEQQDLKSLRLRKRKAKLPEGEKPKKKVLKNDA